MINSDSIRQLAKFADKYLEGNLDNLVTFPLARLKGDREFGCPGRNFDPDDTNIARIIYTCVFDSVFEGGLEIEQLEDYEFRGDTLNTYNTMFGRPDETSKHPGLDRYNPSPELCAKVADYDDNWFSRIGNMCVWPNIPFHKDTINTYRGKHPRWRDFTDRFLVELKKVLEEDPEADKGLRDLVMFNGAYTRNLFREEGFEILTGLMCLSDYLDGKYPNVTSKGYYFWMKGVSSEEYLAEADRYIDLAKRVIQNRGELIVTGLKASISTWLKIGRDYEDVHILKETVETAKRLLNPNRTLRLISWNINGIKSHYNELKELATQYNPDFICLQKVKSKEGVDPYPIEGYKRLWRPCDYGQYSGVAAYLRNDYIVLIIDTPELSDDGHLQAIDLGGFYLLNTYVPYTNKNVDGSYERRKEWNQRFIPFVAQLSKEKPCVICGDLNIVHQPIDAVDKIHLKNAGNYYVWEHEDFELLLKEANLADSFREIHPNEPKFSYFVQDVHKSDPTYGWRLDYTLVSRSLLPEIKQADILNDFGTSPSVPMILDFAAAKTQL